MPRHVTPADRLLGGRDAKIVTAAAVPLVPVNCRRYTVLTVHAYTAYDVTSDPAPLSMRPVIATSGRRDEGGVAESSSQLPPSCQLIMLPLTLPSEFVTL